jgi:dihydroneopterin aldolase
MMQEVTIGLKNLKFFANHGVYDFEKENGNWFEVDIEMRYNHPNQNDNFVLEETLDYEKAAALCESCMNTPTPLLETVAHQILNRLKLCYENLTYATVELRKMNPPIKQTCSYTYVRMTYHRE